MWNMSNHCQLVVHQVFVVLKKGVAAFVDIYMSIIIFTFSHI